MTSVGIPLPTRVQEIIVVVVRSFQVEKADHNKLFADESPWIWDPVLMGKSSTLKLEVSIQ